MRTVLQQRSVWIEYLTIFLVWFAITQGRGFKYYHMVGENLDMLHNLWDIQEDNTYTHYLPIPKLEV